jgi:tetratricopeptide (TPR) repeat protein
MFIQSMDSSPRQRASVVARNERIGAQNDTTLRSILKNVILNGAKRSEESICHKGRKAQRKTQRKKAYVSLIAVSCFLCTAFFPLPLFGQSVRSHINGGNDLYKDQKYSDAEAEYKKGLEKDNQLMQGYFNLGDAMYKQQRRDEAIQNYETALSKTKDPVAASKIYHNIGNVLCENKKYAEAISAYKHALTENSKDDDTRYNLAYAQRMLRQDQQQQKNQNKDKKDDKKDQKKKDQENKDKDKQNKDQQQNKQDQNQAQNKQQEKQMSKPEAQRILEALKNDEKDLQKKLRRRTAVRINVEKDW